MESVGRPVIFTVSSVSDNTGERSIRALIRTAEAMAVSAVEMKVSE